MSRKSPMVRTKAKVKKEALKRVRRDKTISVSPVTKKMRRVVSSWGGREAVRSWKSAGRKRVRLSKRTTPATTARVIMFLRCLRVSSSAVMNQVRTTSTSVARGVKKSAPRMGRAGCSQKMTTTLAMSMNHVLPWLRKVVAQSSEAAARIRIFSSAI